MTTIRARFPTQCPVCDAVIRRRELITAWTDPNGKPTWVHTQQCAPAVGAAIPDRIGASRASRPRRRRGRA
jgi:hypothetical protein